MGTYWQEYEFWMLHIYLGRQNHPNVLFKFQPPLTSQAREVFWEIRNRWVFNLCMHRQMPRSNWTVE